MFGPVRGVVSQRWLYYLDASCNLWIPHNSKSSFMRKLIFFAFLAFLSFTAALGCKGQPTEHIKVVLKKYSFDPPVIKVKSGNNIELELSAADVQHGFSVPQLGIKEAVQPGQPAAITFKAPAKG